MSPDELEHRRQLEREKKEREMKIFLAYLYRALNQIAAGIKKAWLDGEDLSRM